MPNFFTRFFSRKPPEQPGQFPNTQPLLGDPTLRSPFREPAPEYKPRDFVADFARHDALMALGYFDNDSPLSTEERQEIAADLDARYDAMSALSGYAHLSIADRYAEAAKCVQEERDATDFPNEPLPEFDRGYSAMLGTLDRRLASFVVYPGNPDSLEAQRRAVRDIAVGESRDLRSQEQIRDIDCPSEYNRGKRAAIMDWSHEHNRDLKKEISALIKERETLTEQTRHVYDGTPITELPPNLAQAYGRIAQIDKDLAQSGSLTPSQVDQFTKLFEREVPAELAMVSGPLPTPEGHAWAHFTADDRGGERWTLFNQRAEEVATITGKAHSANTTEGDWTYLYRSGTWGADDYLQAMSDITKDIEISRKYNQPAPQPVPQDLLREPELVPVKSHRRCR